MIKNMIILGLNASPWLAVGHDAAAALIIDGDVKIAIEEERLTRKKRAYDTLPILSSKCCLDYAKLTLDDIDCVVFDWDFEKVGLGKTNYLVSESEIADKFFPKKYFDYKKIPKMLFVEHHLAHASSTFRCSGFDSSAILIVDGQGEYCSSSIWYGKNGKIRKIWSNTIEESIGYMYSSIERYIGMRNGDEGKLMGLAPYGTVRKDIVDTLKKISIKINKEDLNKKSGQQKIVVSQWLKEIDKKFDKKDSTKTGFNKMTGQFSKSVNFNQFQKDLAASAQYFLEQKILELVDKAVKLTGCKNLCIAGGVALNCIANQKVLESGKIENIYVPPAPNDAGCAIGAALEVYSKSHNITKRLDNAYLGLDYTDAEIQKELDNFKIKYTKTTDSSKYCANLLSKGKIVGWFQGRMEFGPRALGNRSVLANPTSAKMWEEVNIVKERELWRPLAPSILVDYVKDYFELENDFHFMIIGSKVKKNKIDKVSAVVHVDNTSRPHAVEMNLNPKYYKLIKHFEKLSGVPIVLNTSFNGKAEPIVCTPRDAIKAFYSSGLDYLIIGNYVIKK